MTKKSPFRCFSRGLIALLLSLSAVHAQVRTVTGSVSDGGDGSALPGVTVVSHVIN